LVAIQDETVEERTSMVGGKDGTPGKAKVQSYFEKGGYIVISTRKEEGTLQNLGS